MKIEAAVRLQASAAEDKAIIAQLKDAGFPDKHAKMERADNGGFYLEFDSGTMKAVNAFLKKQGYTRIKDANSTGDVWKNKKGGRLIVDMDPEDDDCMWLLID